jgi:hypothetical protein
MEEECLPELPHIKLKSASMHEMYFVPLQPSQPLTSIFDDFDFNEALELESK